MSQYFQAGDLVLWKTASRVAELFFRTGEAIAPAVGLETGIAPEGFTATATALVMVQRAGRSVLALAATPTLDPRDVSIGPLGVSPLGDAERLRPLAAQCAPAMPV